MNFHTTFFTLDAHAEHLCLFYFQFSFQTMQSTKPEFERDCKTVAADPVSAGILPQDRSSCTQGVAAGKARYETDIKIQKNKGGKFLKKLWWGVLQDNKFGFINWVDNVN